MATSPTPHVIRLRGPWEQDFVEPLAGTRWIRFQRRFGLPTGLAAGDRIDLVIERCHLPGCVWLNDAWLGELSAAATPVRFSIRDFLQDRNLLALIFATTESNDGGFAHDQGIALAPSGVPVAVRLEIHANPG